MTAAPGLGSCRGRGAAPRPSARRPPAVLVAVIAAMLAWGCALQTYEPRPLDPAASARRLTSRDLSEPGLRQHLAANGETEWPPANWNAPRLVLAALYFHPEVAEAAARIAVSEAEQATARSRRGSTLELTAAQHSDRPGGASPWALGLVADFPLAASDRRAALIARADGRAEAYRLEAAETAWRVRQRVHTALAELHAGRQAHALAVQSAAIAGEIAERTDRRAAAGAARRVEALEARRRQSMAAARVAALEGRSAEALAALAAAVGVPAAALENVELSFGRVETFPDVPEPPDARQSALLNRLDVRRALALYSASEAELRLEIARQYPELTLRPGFLWDQGDRVWSLGALLAAPFTAGNAGPIGEAQARREAAARSFESVQAGVIARTESARARYARAGAELAAMREAERIADQALGRERRRAAAGDASELDLARARLAVVEARELAQRALAEAQRSLLSLEDALQRPLDIAEAARIGTTAAAGEADRR